MCHHHHGELLIVKMDYGGTTSLHHYYTLHCYNMITTTQKKGKPFNVSFLTFVLIDFKLKSENVSSMYCFPS